MPHTPAYKRYIESMKLEYEQWHDGEGYDLEALAETSHAEKQQICELLTSRDVTWREVEALAQLSLPEAKAAIDAASQHHLNIDTRLAAAEVMHEQGRLPEIEQFLAKQIRALHDPAKGLTRALLMAEDFPSDTIKQALLWASWNQTECAPHCAGLLCYLAGVGKDQFDWDLRPLFLKLGLHNSYFERKEAFDELSKRVNMKLDTSQAF